LRAGGRIEADIEGQLMGTGGLHSSSKTYIYDRRLLPAFNAKSGRRPRFSPLPFLLGPCLLLPKNLNFFQDFPSHQIFIHMYKLLNIDKNKN